VDLRTYLRRLFERPKEEVAAATVVQNFSICFSDSCAISFWSDF
jgi:hypothetical protein